MALFNDLLASPAGRVSGRRCQAHVARLSQMHRIMGSPGYHEAAAYVEAQLDKLGLPEIVVERFPMNGARAYGDWIAPAAWQARAAELWVESPERFRVCDYQDTPVCLHVGSQSTPAGGSQAELIDIGDGLKAGDYAGRDVRGQIVLTSGNVAEVYEEAVRRRGALGLVSDYMPWPAPGAGRSAIDQPDLISYNKINVRYEEMDHGRFSFGISARQGIRLRHLLRQGPVRMRAMVEAQSFAGEMEVLSARIPGSETPERELVLVAHLCHPQPGANDNASGPALILELARSLLTAQQTGQSPRLRHSLRLLFVPEAYGTIAWLLESRVERGEMLLALNLDMVGGDSAQTGGYIWLDQTPWSLPSYLNDFVAALLADVAAETFPGWRYGLREHGGGSDHILFLPPEFAIPALMLGHNPDRFYHSNQDTVDKTAPGEFERVGRVTMATLLGVDQLTAERARLLAHLVYHCAVQRLVNYAQQTVQQVLAGRQRSLDDYQAVMQTLLAKEQAALGSIIPHTRLEGQKTAAAEAEFLAGRLAEVNTSQLELMVRTIGPLPADTPLPEDKRVPQRLFRGPISTPLMGLSCFHEKLGERADFYLTRSKVDLAFVRWLFEASNLIDGRHTLSQIQAILAAEFGRDTARVVEDLGRFVDDLVSVGMATLSD